MSFLKSALLTSATVAAIAVSAPNFAALKDCPAGYTHCAYMTGLSNNSKDGRFIKYNIDGVYEDISCMNNDGALAFYPDTPIPVGEHTIKFSICDSGDDKYCELVSVDKITVTKASNAISVTPPTFEVNVTVLAKQKQFNQCDAAVEWAKHATFTNPSKNPA